MISSLLGGLTPRQFLEEYWQKKPLIVRGAIPGFKGLIARDELLALACRDDVESRLINCNDWTMKHGPLAQRDIAQRKATAPWTVLVQGVNLLLDDGDELLREFDFIPYARLDDLMASYATNGGGVGPHLDNYDVFLLQGAGQRHWRIGAQKDRTLVDGLPLKILRNFTPTQEFVLDPGDMLYLPPQYAHDGIAIGECTTWSIGFRAPPHNELGDGFLTYLQDRLALDGRYADPGMRLQRHAAEIGDDMIDRVSTTLAKIQWNRATVADFLGCYLTEPKQNVFFDAPEKRLSQKRFEAAAVKQGVHLDRKSQLLFTGKQFYINGEKVAVPSATRQLVVQLANTRSLKVGLVSASVTDLFYEWYCDGFLHLA